MDTQAPPTSGARLTPQAIEGLIARRLDALGHPPDLLDRYAVAALVADAAGSGRRLRSSLAATLFLASTEDAPQIDADLVHRALTSPPPAPKLPSPLERPSVSQPSRAPAVRPGRLKASRFYLVAGFAALAVALANLLLRPPADEPATAALQAPQPQQISVQQSSAPSPPPPVKGTLANPVPGKAPLALDTLDAAKPPANAAPANSPVGNSLVSNSQPAAPAGLAPLPAPVDVRSLPVPPSSQQAASSGRLPPLPDSAPAAIVLLYPSRDSRALNRLAPIALSLQNAGMNDIRAKPVHAPPPRRVISYFYGNDRPLADSVAKILTESTWPRLNGNSLQPSLVLPPQGVSVRNPGTIEVQLP